MKLAALTLPILAAIGLAASAVPSVAAEDLGQFEYLNACASCHGSNAKGEGDIAKLLTVEVPDLTKLAERNGGTFPLLDVIYVIDGRTGVRGHGGDVPVWGNSLRIAPETSDAMPVWGDYFRDRVGEVAGPFGAETVVRGRVLSLALYLASIQE